MPENNFPKLHNAMWPGIVGKGSPDSEPAIELDTLLDFTAKAEVDGTTFDGVDLFLYSPHVDIDSSDEAIEALAEKISSRGLQVGSVVAPVWFDGTAMGDEDSRKGWLKAVEKSVRIAAKLRELGIRPHGLVRIDSAASVADWAKDPQANTKRIAQTFREAGKIAAASGERLAAEGEICWGGMHSWRHMIDLLEETGMPETVGFQADMSHTLLYTLGENAPEHRIVPADYHWEPDAFHAAMKQLTDALRPWTFDFHVAQNDGSVFGSGDHEKTGRHCVATDPKGKLNIARDSGYWLRDSAGEVTKAIPHICWDGCMFPNSVMTQQQTWNDILSAMIEVRKNHGWHA
ncbi:TIM barrel protein [Pelagicoccus sp. SDUM812005]|uniref:TIM barrel protein n=1 Tax=Pelagicoccus sp. SDUM812005 TaxID=3041257 RepID=UPI00280E2AD1|nr:TIM barrel protein [Pelagicoccus sp. SDUM812005]MDQ8182035.1 TIM barrel protein [Pelagicoccus sp. SDUM812005]